MPGSRYISTQFSPWLLARRLLGGPATWRRFGFVMSRADGERMRTRSQLVSAGQLVPVIESIVSFERIAEAHARLERGHTHGTIVIRMPG